MKGKSMKQGSNVHAKFKSPTIKFKRNLGLFDATMIVMGGMVGAGIFLNPAFVAQTLNSSTQIILAWILGGFIAFLGALVFSELGAMMPEVGGQYVYISRAIHPLLGFLNGWGLFWVIATGAIAFVTVMTAEYATTLFGFSHTIIKPTAIGIVWILSIINYFGIRWCTLLIIWGSYVQLLNYVVFVEWLFFSLSGMSLMIFRKTLPQKERPFKILGYPVTPLIFIIFSIFIVINTFLTQPIESAIGLIILLSGIPIYLFRSKKSGSA